MSLLINAKFWAFFTRLGSVPDKYEPIPSLVEYIWQNRKKNWRQGCSIFFLLLIYWNIVLRLITTLEYYLCPFLKLRKLTIDKQQNTAVKVCLSNFFYANENNYSITPCVDKSLFREKEWKGNMGMNQICVCSRWMSHAMQLIHVTYRFRW